jgi:DNA-binding MarR family transcriptional regulator
MPTATTARPNAARYVLEDQVGHLLRRAHQRHAALFATAMDATALTPTQWAALAKLVELGQATQNLLGRLIAMDPATTQGVVRRLVERGLVARAPDPADRRSIVLSATAQGRALHDAALDQAHAATDATLAPLTEVEAQKFLALLRRLT